MAQIYTVDCFDTSHEWDVDLQAMENNHEAHRTSFSGTNAPTSPAAGQPWLDTNNSVQKIRNAANDAWLANLVGDADFKIPVYRNDTCQGWLIDATVTDRIIALKGGSDAYNANGGTNAGVTWAAFNAHEHDAGDHLHRWYNQVSDNTDDHIFDSDGNQDDIPTPLADKDTGFIGITCGGENCLPNDAYTETSSDTTGGPDLSDLRPAAALCTLQYPDLT